MFMMYLGNGVNKSTRALLYVRHLRMVWSFADFPGKTLAAIYYLRYWSEHFRQIVIYKVLKF